MGDREETWAFPDGRAAGLPLFGRGPGRPAPPGVHLVLSAPIPVPGLRNLARFSWTVVFWAIAQYRLLRHKVSSSTGRLSNIHGPLVMVVSLLPVVGPFAYLTSRPLRNNLLFRLVLDQVAWKLPFKLYVRLRLDRLLAPAPKA